MNVYTQLTYNLQDKILSKLFKPDNYKNLINHFKVIREYSKYEFGYKRNNYNNFYMYYFEYRLRFKRKVPIKFVDYCKTNNIIKL